MTVEAFLDAQCDWLHWLLDQRRAELEAMTHDERMTVFVDAVRGEA